MRALALAFVLVLAVAASAVAQELTLSAAISMKEAVEQIGRQFVAGHPGTTLRFNFGSSGELQKQIEAGAPPHVFISAPPRPMGGVPPKEPILPPTPPDFAPHRLLLVKTAGSAVRSLPSLGL